MLLPLILQNTNTTLLVAKNWKFAVSIQTKLNIQIYNYFEIHALYLISVIKETEIFSGGERKERLK